MNEVEREIRVKLKLHRKPRFIVLSEAIWFTEDIKDVLKDYPDVKIAVIPNDVSETVEVV